MDLFLVETIFDTLNAKAALYALERFFEDKQLRLPVFVRPPWISGSVVLASAQAAVRTAAWQGIISCKAIAHRACFELLIYHQLHWHSTRSYQRPCGNISGV